ncbi:Regulator of chromosome condensation (RCC1) family with FYVE zinc finger domain isoform 2 [Hibiscus syriacus]|uniref:Regulator of chromosome condensation (RCC1) family with FYVE zinc finger domain isoform 2 n=1 Tax=Hibiscus syriacus TaxID=106335 RepID=A0A6A2WYS6_HIBSY|nr:Regulator of chromosome condensation (RCC1) family with FYVE zinc finger domain isoform 2 [Hibiscus syriacus]
MGCADGPNITVNKDQYQRTDMIANNKDSEKYPSGPITRARVKEFQTTMEKGFIERGECWDFGVEGPDIMVDLLKELLLALIALKKGAQLLKYGCKGKAKFCPFKLSNAIFQRYLRREKEYLSFSLIYDNVKRSLDLICKEKAEAEVRIVGLKELISSGQSGRSKIDGWIDGGFYLDEIPSSFDFFRLVFVSHTASEVTNMDVKGSSSYVFRVSVSSAPSTSSHGSTPDDYDALGDVYIWGEVICDSAMKVVADKNANYFSMRADVLLPRPLEYNVVLDVHHVACGVKHAGLVTRQGEVFTWGEESRGQIGHGVGTDVIQPRLVESLDVTSVDFVVCGEFHTCAVTMAGELYTWGDGTHNVGLLGHGTDVSH